MYPKRLWDVDTTEKIIYLSFDDGPHPVATPFVLDELKKYNAKATFFCIGKNVDAYPEIYRRILNEGHRAGNHTNNHLNGFRTDDKTYLADVSVAAGKIGSGLFRPPYGRLRSSQAKKIHEAMNDPSSKIVMWDILSGDFDTGISNERCLRNATNKVVNGSIILFHDSEKALPRLEYTLPRTLLYFSQKGFQFDRL